MTHAWPRESLDIWMHNASADLCWHEATHVPMTCAHARRSPNTSYITSLRSGWFDYAAHELQERWWAAWGLRAAGRLAQWMGLDDVVLVGNLPISTNVWTDAQLEKFNQICEEVVATHPHSFVGVRNLQHQHHQALMTQLRRQGFHAIPARVVYEFDLRNGLKTKPSHVMRDRTALKRSGLQTHVAYHVSNTEATRLHDLYLSIYIDKHSPLNAQYTTQFFADTLGAQVMQALLLKNDAGQILAFAMLYQVGRTLTVPALGYDMTSETKGLYRLLFAAILQHTQDHQLLLNYSSGAGDFKRKRGGIAHLEYTLLRAPSARGRWQANILTWLEARAYSLHAQDLIALGA